MDFNSVIKNRYSCRAFVARAVEQEKVGRSRKEMGEFVTRV